MSNLNNMNSSNGLIDETSTSGLKDSIVKLTVCFPDRHSGKELILNDDDSPEDALQDLHFELAGKSKWSYFEFCYAKLKNKEGERHLVSRIGKDGDEVELIPEKWDGFFKQMGLSYLKSDVEKLLKSRKLNLD